MHPEHDRLIAKIQHFYDLILKFKEETELDLIKENSLDKKTNYKAICECYQTLAAEFEAIFDNFVYHK